MHPRSWKCSVRLEMQMSEESSPEQDVEVPEVSPPVFRSFNGFPISSETTESRDKDTLIDEMQAKFGELLKVNEELCAARNEIESLKEIIGQRQQDLDKQADGFKRRISELEDNLQEASDTIANQKQRIADLKDDNSRLESENAELKQKLATMIQNSDSETRHKVDTQTGELRATVADKDREIAVLKQKLSELKTRQASSSDSVEHHKIENDKLQSRVERQQTEIDKHVEEKSKMNVRLQKQKEVIASLEQRTKELELELTATKSEVKNLKERELLGKEKLGKKDADCFVAREEVQRVLSISPGFKDIDELIDYMTKTSKETASLKEDVKQSHASLKKCLRRIKRYEAALQEADKRVDEAELKARSFQDEMRSKCRQADRLTKENERYQRRLRILPVFDKANSMLNQRLSRIRESIRGEEDITSVKTLTAAVIMITRWRHLVGTEEKYTDDSRNWWWMNPDNSYQVTTERIAEKITALDHEVSQLREETNMLKESLQSEKQKVKAAHSETEAAKRECDVQIAQNHQLQSQIEDLQAELETKIDPQVHQKTLAELKVIKEKYKKAKVAAKQNDMEMTNLQMSLSQARQKLNEQITLTRKKERSLKDAQIELFQAQEGIAYWRQGNAAKTKDLLALERGLTREQRTSAAVRMQNDVLALEHRKLGMQVNAYKKKISAAAEQQV